MPAPTRSVNPRPITLAVTAALSATTVGMAGCLIVVDGDGWDHGHQSYQWEDRARRTWTEDIDAALLEDSAELHVATRAGDITIETTTGPASVKIHAASRDADRLSEMTIEPRVENGVLIIEPDWPGGWQNRDVCEIVLRVPVRDGVSVESTAGDVIVEGMQGPLSIETSAGDVDIRHHTGSIRVETSAGDIAVADSTGPIELRTSAGDIELDTVGWPIAASTSAGDIDASMVHGFSGVLRATTTSGDLDLPSGASITRSGSRRSGTVTLGDGDAECVFRTSAGDVAVQVLRPRE